MKQKLFTGLKIVVTVVLIGFLVMSIGLDKLGGVLAQVRLLPFVLAVALYAVALLVGAVKWQVLVKAQEIDASLGALLSFSLVGLFLGNVMPSNVGGDVVRAYDLARATRGRAEAAAISVLVDRLMGLVANLGAAVVMALLAGFMLARANQIENLAVVTVVAAGVFVGGLVLLFSRRVSRRLAFLFDRQPLARVKPLARKIYDALQVYRFRYRALAVNVTLSGVIVVVTAFVWYTVGVAVGITNVSFVYFLLFNPLIAFVLLIPVSINGLGPKELTVVTFFSLIGVPQEQALSMSLLFHVILVLTSLPGGVLWFRARNLVPPQNSQIVE
ncbi:MAG: lysylphosphatidylglycerol synthase transmembrane domain-containing protein [Anaerolineae bacterium]